MKTLMSTYLVLYLARMQPIVDLDQGVVSVFKDLQ